MPGKRLEIISHLHLPAMFRANIAHAVTSADILTTGPNLKAKTVMKSEGQKEHNNGLHSKYSSSLMPICQMTYA